MLWVREETSGTVKQPTMPETNLQFHREHRLIVSLNRRPTVSNFTRLNQRLCRKLPDPRVARPPFNPIAQERYRFTATPTAALRTLTDKPGALNGSDRVPMRCATRRCRRLHSLIDGTTKQPSFGANQVGSPMNASTKRWMIAVDRPGGSRSG